MTNRYLLFSGEEYYPDGGAEDFKSSHRTLAEVMDSVSIDSCDWANVFDTEALKIVRWYYKGHWSYKPIIT
jgi:hypothetical protein